MSNPSGPTATILYHFFHPDDVISARHFSDFAEELARRGWKVTALTSNRYCRYPQKKIEIREESWKGVRIIRVGRPGWSQTRQLTRLANSLWMSIGWLSKIITLPKTDVILLGSDPQFSQILFPILKKLRPAAKIVYWCYDLFPDAILADGASPLVREIAQASKEGIKNAYKSLDLLVDIGQCMGRRLESYDIRCRRATLTPWALLEPSNLEGPEPAARQELFGDSDLALLYSGNMGKAHNFELFLKLARYLAHENSRITFCFACRGNRYGELKEAVGSRDHNIRLAPFAEESELGKRLNAADIHLLSLRPGWEGVVVPSKFFGSLAVGKPVLYAGPEGSSIAHWVKEFDLGLIMSEENLSQIAGHLLRLARNKRELNIWRQNAWQAYRGNFSKEKVMDRWDKILRDLVEKK